MGELAHILLAAGKSTRSGASNKLLALLPDGCPVVRAAARHFLASGAKQLFVVVGHRDQDLRQALQGLPVFFVRAERYEEGMGRSLAAAVSQCEAECGGFLVAPADLPWLQPATIRRVRETFLALGGGHSVVPQHEGQRGHPVVLRAGLRAALEALSGEQGARGLLLEEHAQGRVQFLDVSDSGIHRDVDTGLNHDGFPNP